MMVLDVRYVPRGCSLLGVLCVALCLAVVGCGRRSQRFVDRTRSSSDVRYFQTLSSYDAPTRPLREITRDAAEQLDRKYAYYEARYDEEGKLAAVTKCFQGRRVFRIDYFYGEADRVRRCTTTELQENGRLVHEQIYDERERLIKSIRTP